MFRHIMKEPWYSNLLNLKPEDTCEILLVCLNPFIKEMFEWHPKRDQLNLHWPGYWTPASDREMRLKNGFHLEDVQPPGPSSPPIFYSSGRDKQILSELNLKKTIVVSASAGTKDRNIPDAVMFDVLRFLKTRDFDVVGIGRTFERGGGHEEFDYGKTGFYARNLVDQLSIPGTIELVSKCAGVISCHSAAILMAWWFRKPNILIVPKNVSHANKLNERALNDWTFGIFHPESQFVLAEEMEPVVLEQFTAFLRT